jgi:hypothetical protein
MIQALAAQAMEIEEDQSEEASMVWIGQRSVRWGSCMPDSMTSPLRKMKGKHR